MIIRDAQQLFALLEDGELSRELIDDMNAAMQKCRDVAGGKGKASASVTMKIKLTVEGVSLKIDCDYDVKAPKMKRSSTLFYATDRGISDQHPKQTSMAFRDVSEPKSSAAE